MSRPKWEKEEKVKVAVVPETKIDKWGRIDKAEKVNFRSKPKIDRNVIEVLEKGTRVKILESYSEWIKAAVNDKEGYIMKGYVKPEE